MMTHELALHAPCGAVLSFETKRDFPLIRLAAFSFILSGILVTLFSILAPSFALLSYSCGMAAFILLPLGFLGVYSIVQNTKAERFAFWALVLSWFGVGLTLPILGAQVFSLRVLRQPAIDEGLLNSLDFHFGLICLVTGLALIAGAAIVLDVAIRNTRNLPQLSAILIALGLVIYLPLFGRDPNLQLPRVADALLILAGCLWLGWGMWTQANSRGLKQDREEHNEKTEASRVPTERLTTILLGRNRLA
jgi:hypothetical protein